MATQHAAAVEVPRHCNLRVVHRGHHDCHCHQHAYGTFPNLQDAFHTEEAIVKACRNKNIVGYLGNYVDDERTLLIMEYMEVC